MTNLTKLFLTSFLAVSLLFTANCKHNKRPGDGETGVILASLIKDLASGSCAISVNYTGVWYGTIIQQAVNENSGTTYSDYTSNPGAVSSKSFDKNSPFDVANVFDYANYKEVTGEALESNQWSSLSYNRKFDAFFSDGGNWNTTTRNAALAAKRGQLNTVAIMGYPNTACYTVTLTNTATEISKDTFKATAQAMYNALSTDASNPEKAEVDAFLKGVSLGIAASSVLPGLTALGVTNLATAKSTHTALGCSTMISNKDGSNPTNAGACIGLDGYIKMVEVGMTFAEFVIDDRPTKTTIIDTTTATTALTEYSALTDSKKAAYVLGTNLSSMAQAIGASAANNACSGNPYRTSTLFVAVGSALTGVTSTAFVTSIASYGPTVDTTFKSVYGLRYAAGTGILACAQIPKSNCNVGAFLTPTVKADMDAAKGIVNNIIANDDCRKPNPGFNKAFAFAQFKGMKADATNYKVTGLHSLTEFVNMRANEGNPTITTPGDPRATSNFTGNKILADKAYPKFGNLVDLGFGTLMPMKEGTGAYSTNTASTTETAFQSMTSGGNISVSSVESCVGLGLAVGPFPEAPNGVMKPLTGPREIVYAFSPGGQAAQAYSKFTVQYSLTNFGGYDTTNSKTYYVDVNVNVDNGIGTVTFENGKVYYVTSFNGTTGSGSVKIDSKAGTSAVTGTLSISVTGVTLPLAAGTTYTGKGFVTGVTTFGVGLDGNQYQTAIDGTPFTLPMGMVDDVACNNSFRDKVSIPQPLGGGKLPKIDARFGDGEQTTLLSLCVYGADANTRALTKAALNASLGGNPHAFVPAVNGVGDCSDAAKAAAAQFNGMTTK
jgi:hypothetical protein